MDDLQRKELAARREMPATKAALDEYRKVLMENWLKTPVDAVADREGIFQQVKAANRIENYLSQAQGMGSEDIEAHAKNFAATPE